MKIGFEFSNSNDEAPSAEPRVVRKEALTLSDQTPKTRYSGPGYYCVTRDGAPQDGPYQTYSLAIANLKGRDAIEYLDQPKVAPLLEEWPTQLRTVNGSLQQHPSLWDVV